MLANVKRWTLDIFHGVSRKRLQAHLDEFCNGLSRRDKREDLFRRVLNRCERKEWSSERIPQNLPASTPPRFAGAAVKWSWSGCT